jgi:hypothetical protein
VEKSLKGYKAILANGIKDSIIDKAKVVKNNNFHLLAFLSNKRAPYNRDLPKPLFFKFL